MILYPAIDILAKQAVRLKQGDYETAKTVFSDPLQAALDFEKQGAEFLHIVDLDGAKNKLDDITKSPNFEVIKNILENIKTPVQLGGGIRHLSYIGELLELGIKRVVLGSKAIEDKKFFMEACRNFEGKIALGLDIYKDKIKTQGWLKDSTNSLANMLSLATDYGVSKVIYTDIEKDGMLAGIDFSKITNFAKSSQVPVIASGGITTLSDINRLASINNVDGAIIGKALYNNNFTLTAALMEVETGG